VAHTGVPSREGELQRASNRAAMQRAGLVGAEFVYQVQIQRLPSDAPYNALTPVDAPTIYSWTFFAEEHAWESIFQWVIAQWKRRNESVAGDFKTMNMARKRRIIDDFFTVYHETDRCRIEQNPVRCQPVMWDPKTGFYLGDDTLEILSSS
jgi:hypothetical protein